MQPCRTIRWLFVAAMVAAPVSTLSAQAALGVIAGVNRSSFVGGGSIDVTGRNALMIGMVGQIPLAETYSLRSELFFSTKGARLRTPAGDPGDGPIKPLELPYIQMPVLVQLSTGGAGPLRPQLYAGAAVGLLLGCTLGSLDCDDDDGINQRRVDVGLVMGGEIAWRRIGLGVRYEAGIRTVDATLPGNEIYNGALTFAARYMFRR